jgi:hypothetical protein
VVLRAARRYDNRFEALNDLAALNPVEIRLIGTGHDETGTTGRAAQIWLKDDEARGDRSR